MDTGRALADEQLIRDPPVGPAFGDERKDLAFAAGQTEWIGGGGRFRGRRGRSRFAIGRKLIRRRRHDIERLVPFSIDGQGGCEDGSQVMYGRPACTPAALGGGMTLAISSTVPASEPREPAPGAEPAGSRPNGGQSRRGQGPAGIMGR